MNNYTLIVLTYENEKSASLHLNYTIQYFNERNIEIIDITSNVTKFEKNLSYVFVIKLKGRHSVENFHDEYM
ncbi:hypothetical protein NYE67_02600 [Solibacillus sp. FSL W8-0474]|uniref:hypothetical protein n=1 Tax=Solibacillus sp. FSL W8-0474 TaxID=2975336 RepID=UPI0030F911EF